jgi:biopolymer transport protein ExbB/TolQ
MEQSIWELLSHGGGAMWVVVAFSVIALAVAIERAIAQWKFVSRARTLGETVTRCLARGALEEGRSACERSRSPVADIFLVGYERLGRAKPEHVATAVHRERLRVNQDLRTRLWMLGTIGATAPFVGLFGTVVGIMTSFQAIAGSKSTNLAVVAPGIAEALLATAIGLLAAIPAVIAYNKLSSDAGKIAVRMEGFADEFSAILSRQIDEKVAPRG